MASGRQIAHRDEAIVLRTWPFHEADLLVSIFTRGGGKVKGVARHAMRSRRRFGGALEAGTVVRAAWMERPKEELVRMDAFEIEWSPLRGVVDARRLAGMQLVVEAVDEAMPDGAADDHVYRLTATVLRALGGEASQGENPRPGGAGPAMHSQANGCGVDLAVTYFCLWMARLMGWMPEFGVCAACGAGLAGADVWWTPAADGVTCFDDRRGGAARLSAASVADSRAMARTPLGVLCDDAGWTAERLAGLRGFGVGLLERHMERRLRSAAALSF